MHTCACVVFKYILYKGSLRETEPLGDRNYINNKKYVRYRDYTSRNCGT